MESLTFEVTQEAFRMWDRSFYNSLPCYKVGDRWPFRFVKHGAALMLAGMLLSLPPAFGVPLPGDLNQDGHLTIQDATLSLQISVGLLNASKDQRTADDVNGDGLLDVADSVLILRAIVGLVVLPTSPPAEQVCVDKINQLRSTLSLPPLSRLISMEPCVSQEAKTDAAANTAHSAFGACKESAQNECPDWPGPPESMIGNCLNQMWAEGPGADFPTHGHYINMTNPAYTAVACGFYVQPDGSVWSAQDFK